MKKAIVTLLVLLTIGLGFYIYKKRNRTTYVDETFEELKATRKQLDSVRTVLAGMSGKPDSLTTSKDASDETDALNLEIAQLRSENKELRRELDSRKQNVEAKSTNKKTTHKKDETTIPIARNTRAIELQRYLTELYGNR